VIVHVAVYEIVYESGRGMVYLHAAMVYDPVNDDNNAHDIVAS